jgi:hypothetical protein
MILTVARSGTVPLMRFTGLHIRTVICDIWLRALSDDVLTQKQRKVAQQAHIFLSAFAHVGIIALVDEATGYQETLDKLELQLILKLGQSLILF